MKNEHTHYTHKICKQKGNSIHDSHEVKKHLNCDHHEKWKITWKISNPNNRNTIRNSWAVNMVEKNDFTSNSRFIEICIQMTGFWTDWEYYKNKVKDRNRGKAKKIMTSSWKVMHLK